MKKTFLRVFVKREERNAGERRCVEEVEIRRGESERVSTEFEHCKIERECPNRESLEEVVSVETVSRGGKVREARTRERSFRDRDRDTHGDPTY